MTFSIKQVLAFLVLGFFVGVISDAYVNTKVIKNMCQAQRETRRIQTASKAQLLAVPVAFNIRDARLAQYLPKLPVKELRK